LETIQSILGTGLIPMFYQPDPKTAVALTAACARGGARAVELTSRGGAAYPVFGELVRTFAADDSVILGVGSITDAPTAALFLAAGANFIVGPNFNPEIMRLCKLFPAEAAGGPDFVRAVMAPSPWHRLLATGGIDASEAGVAVWIKAGAAALGMGSKLVTKDTLEARDFAGLETRVAECIGWIRKARA
jgi:2-dehydro-3-deoxyphosphogluconate aldolase/(4S)-4-hydroxy-2-oxoglutarate aldolase